MGWLYTRSLNGFQKPIEYLDSTFTVTKDDQTLKVLRSAIVNTVYYAAIEHIKYDGETQKRMVFAAVCLTDGSPNNFGHKDMDETFGPNASECPVAILNLLTETDNEYALAWRARCRENSRRKRAA